MPFAPTTDIIGLLIGAVIWGTLHGLTPHGHSWLVLLPLALGGANRRAMFQMALAYSIGMLATAAVAGALLGFIFSFIPEAWHHALEVGVGAAVTLIGFTFLFKPLSVHHVVDHMCSEHCHTGEERKLLKTGTLGALTVLGALSMLLPCPNNIWLYALPAVTRSPLLGSLIFSVYALFTGLTVIVVALSMVQARQFVAAIERRGYRLLLLRLSGVVVIALGGWLLWLGLTPHAHGHEHRPPGVHQWHEDAHEGPALTPPAAH